MANLSPQDTGLSCAVQIDRRGQEAAGARVSATQPPWGMNPACVYALRPFALAGGVEWLSDRQRQELAAWADLNAAVLTEYWEARTYYEEDLFRQLRSPRGPRPRDFRVAAMVLRALAPKVRSITWTDGSYHLTFDRPVTNIPRLLSRFARLGFTAGIRLSVNTPTALSERFKIGWGFYCGGRRWRVTDVGTRVVVAICLDDHPGDKIWFNGPPYAVAETVFDEYGQAACEIV